MILQAIFGRQKTEPARLGPICGMCRRKVVPGTACVVFPAFHRWCISAAADRARDAG